MKVVSRIAVWALGFFMVAGCQATNRPETSTQATQTTPSSPALPPRPAAKNHRSFDEWLMAFQVEAVSRGISPSTLKRALAGVRPNPKILELDSRQPEFTRPIWDYLDSAVSAQRIAIGRRSLVKYDGLLKDIYRRYGVPPQYIVAIWGIETSFGKNIGNINVIRALATLAYRGRRQDYGREQLLAALQILENDNLPPSRLRGSWAGAMGQTQFIPTTFLNYAVDYNGDGARDLWKSLPDAFASTANYLASMGWQKNQAWGMEVRLPTDFNWDLINPETRKSVTQWQQLGVRQADGSNLPAVDSQGEIIVPAGHRGPAFLALDNFQTIMQYNTSTSYALAVARLADRVTGKRPLVASWPTDLPPLSRTDKLELQRLLTKRGYNPGEIDGIVGPRTRAAVQAFQKEIRQTHDGYPTRVLLEQLRRGSS
jgi:membrane-bound lytic murein transglycosylase B